MRQIHTTLCIKNFFSFHLLQQFSRYKFFSDLFAVTIEYTQDQNNRQIKGIEQRMSETEAEKNIEIWKVKKLIKSLEMARGNGTSMISLVIPPKGQISLIQKC